MTTYELRPTEADGDTVAYLFTDESALWDYVTETLGYEYGMDATDIIGTDVYGYHYGCRELGGYSDTLGMCDGHIIGTVTRNNH